MTTKYIEQIFTDYIKAKGTQHAILLNGSWGCGKTYFWRNTLEKIAEKNHFKTIYVSLNGISKIDDLNHQFFIKLIPFFTRNQESNIIKQVTKVLGNVLNKLSTNYFNTDLSEIFEGVIIERFNFSEYIVCFDDLERCQIPVKEVLGFINNLVEHKNLKAIILANELEVEKSDGYERIKEKVIGRDLKFEPDIFSILPILFSKYKEKTDFYDFLTSQKDFIIEILVEYKQDNLRIISFYLDTLERIFPVLNNIEVEHIREIVFFSAIITIEYKSGGLSSVDYKDFKDLDRIKEYLFLWNITNARGNSYKEEAERTKTYAEMFYEKYLDKRIKTYFFYPSIYSYILSGYLNQTDLENEIKKHYLEVIPKEVRELRALIDYKFRELSDDDFESLTKSVLQYAKEGKYSIYDYVQIAILFYFFSEKNLITESKNDIDEIIKNGLDNAKLRKQINDSTLESILYFKDKNPDITEIKSLVKEIHDEIKKEEHIANSKEFIECLKNESEVALADFFEKHSLSKEIFQYMEEKRLFNAILDISNKQLVNFTKLLQRGYEDRGILEFLSEDIVCLDNLKTDLSDHLNKNNNTKPLRRYLLSTLEEKLTQVIENLEKIKKT